MWNQCPILSLFISFLNIGSQCRVPSNSNPKRGKGLSKPSGVEFCGSPSMQLFSPKHSSAIGLRVGFKRFGLRLEQSVHGWRRCTKPMVLSGGRGHLVPSPLVKRAKSTDLPHRRRRNGSPPGTWQEHGAKQKAQVNPVLRADGCEPDLLKGLGPQGLRQVLAAGKASQHAESSQTQSWKNNKMHRPPTCPRCRRRGGGDPTCARRRQLHRGA